MIKFKSSKYFYYLQPSLKKPNIFLKNGQYVNSKYFLKIDVFLPILSPFFHTFDQTINIIK